MIEMLLTALIVLFAALTQGLTGFGYSLVSVPMLVIFLSPKLVVPMILIHSMGLNAIILLDCRQYVNMKRIFPLLLFGTAGIPFGTYLLKMLEAHYLKIFIGIMIMIFGVAFMLGFRREVRNERAAFVPIGFISGLLNGSISFSGPPVILFLTNQETPRNVFRATLVAYFLTLNIITLPFFFAGGLITTEVSIKTLIIFPAMAAGAYLGSKLSHRVPEALFRRIALVIVTLSGLLSLFSGLKIF